MLDCSAVNASGLYENSVGCVSDIEYYKEVKAKYEATLKGPAAARIAWIEWHSTGAAFRVRCHRFLAIVVAATASVLGSGAWVVQG
jgi:hypothetical protein